MSCGSVSTEIRSDKTNITYNLQAGPGNNPISERLQLYGDITYFLPAGKVGNMVSASLTAIG
jgi:hypothetical protein